MGYFTGFTSDTRFADTFLHPWEARLSIQKYFELFDDCGLKPVGLFDRYGELDDLQNPLWHMPSVAELSDRANDLRFENNLEIWLTHKDRVVLNEVATAKKIPLNLRSKLPPARWTSGEETKSLSLLHRLILWHGWLYTLYGHEHSQSLDLISKLPLHTAQRLARIGAILPSQADQCGRMKELLAPRHTAMEPPILPLGGLIKKKEFDSICRNLLPNCEEERVTQALKRFESAACGIN